VPTPGSGERSKARSTAVRIVGTAACPGWTRSAPSDRTPPRPGGTNSGLGAARQHAYPADQHAGREVGAPRFAQAVSRAADAGPGRLELAGRLAHRLRQRSHGDHDGLGLYAVAHMAHRRARVADREVELMVGGVMAPHPAVRAGGVATPYSAPLAAWSSSAPRLTEPKASPVIHGEREPGKNEVEPGLSSFT
jgi:hypothetical protein